MKSKSKKAEKKPVSSRKILPLLLVSLLLIFQSACSKPSNDNNGSGQPPPESLDSGEKCESKDFSDPTIIRGDAVFQRRESKSTGLGNVESQDFPIRHAEVFLKSGGSTIQCALTNESGKFELSIPRSIASGTISVVTKADNEFVKAQILDTPASRTVHSIQKDITPSGASSYDAGTLLAPAAGTLEGGAFNIFEQIVRANDFLRGNSSFTVAPKATVIWKAGVNPGDYVGITGGISFFDPEEDVLYILGGIDGDTDNSDTDHFDNSVIVHEYGHFLEKHFSKSDSPGGSHNANSIIDPRLAWSEGWANFFSISVSGEPIYRDTYGNSDGSTGVFFEQNLETNSPPRDIPKNPGEGNFREFSITRAMWDAIDPHPVSGKGTNESGDDVTMPFSEFWNTFSSADHFLSPSLFFHNYGMFMELHEALPSHATLTTLFTSEKQKANRLDYGAVYSGKTTPCQWPMTTTGFGETGSFEDSNQFASNDFYFYQHAGGVVSVKIERTSGTDDLDLYLYKDDYVYGDLETTVGYSNKETPADGGIETVTQSLPSGPYMINVNLFTANEPASASYQISINGEYLCP